MIYIHANVSGRPTDTPRLVHDTTGYLAPGDLTVPGRVTFSLPDGTPPHGATVSWSGGQCVRTIIATTLGVPLPPGHYEGGLLCAPIPTLDYAPPLARLSVSGGSFLANGQRWVAALHTDFRLYRRWLDGDRQPLRRERIDAGSQGPRVFLTCDYLFKVGPHLDGSRFYDELPWFADYLAAQGCYWEAVVYTDRQLTGLGADVWPKVCERLAGYPVLIQLANEYFKNGVDPRAFTPVPNGCPQSPGSFVDGMYPVASWPGGYHAFNPSRGWKWPATVGVTLWELQATWPGCWLIDEPIGAAEADEPGRRASQPELFEKMAVDCAVFGAGGVFHSQAGLMSEAWGPVQRACAEAFFHGLRR